MCWIVEFLHLPRRGTWKFEVVYYRPLLMVSISIDRGWSCVCFGFKSSIAWMAFFQGRLCHNGVFVAGRIDMTLLWHLSRRLCLHCSSAIDHRGQAPAVPRLSFPCASISISHLVVVLLHGRTKPAPDCSGDRGLLSNETGSVLYP